VGNKEMPSKLGTGFPVNAARVGMISYCTEAWPETVLGAIFPGHLAIKGTLMQTSITTRAMIMHRQK